MHPRSLLASHAVLGGEPPAPPQPGASKGSRNTRKSHFRSCIRSWRHLKRPEEFKACFLYLSWAVLWLPTGIGMLSKQPTLLFYHKWTYIALSSGKLEAANQLALPQLGWAVCQLGSCTWSAEKSLGKDTGCTFTSQSGQGIIVSGGLDWSVPLSDAHCLEKKSRKAARQAKDRTIKCNIENVQAD